MSWRVPIAGLLFACVAAALAWSAWHRSPQGDAQSQDDSTPPFDSQDPNAVWDRMVRSGPMSRPRDYFRVIDAPQYIAAEHAGDTMSDDEVVLGFELDGQARAYPINYLNEHEMVREQIGDLPLLVTW